MPSKTIIAIAAIVILVSVALLKGINGAVLGTAIGAIAGLGGYIAGRATKPKQ